MIKWKQRLYALFLRRALGPLLDSPSRQKLHDVIEVSLSEGIFALSDVGICTSYLNSKLQNGGLHIKKAVVESITIQLSLVEGKSSCDGEQASLAWRAMNLGSSVSLVAHVEVNGIELELQPRPKKRRNNNAALAGHPTNTDGDVAADQAKSVLSSYIESALGSLRLTLNATNMSVTLSNHNEQETRSWVELRLPSLSYQDLNVTSLDDSEAASKGESRTTTRTIFEKSILFQGLTVSAGGANAGMDIGSPEASNLESTIALAEGTGKVSIRAVEYDCNNSDAQQKRKEKRVQQDIDVRFNQQVKVSVNETSLLQIRAVSDGFKPKQSTIENDDSTVAYSMTSSELDSMLSTSSGESKDADETDLYTIGGIMKQYQEARQLAERNEMRGGILVPSNAFEEGDHVGEGDPRTFDVFFDANDKSFYHYASMMKETAMTLKESSAASDFVHTKFRLQMVGGGIKLSFRSRKTDTRTFLGPEEYALLAFTDCDVTSRLSSGRTEVSLQIAHLEIDDAQIPNAENDMARVEIGNILTIGETVDDIGGSQDLLVQPACISLHLTVDTDQEETHFLSFEINVKPIALIYRERTLSHLTNIAAKLRCGEAERPRKNTSNPAGHPKDDGGMVLRSVLCAIESVTVVCPVLLEDDISQLFTRCGGRYADGRSLAQPALGFVFDALSLEHKQCEADTSDGTSGSAMPITSMDIHSFLVFASSPEHTSTPSRRKSLIFDIFAAGRLEIEPYIPITIAYKRNAKERTGDTSVAKETFPCVPAFSSFKARQEDEDDDDAIDRVLSEKLKNVNVNSRRALRAQDPQGKMLAETENCDAVVLVHIPELVLDLSKQELTVLLKMIDCLVSTKTRSEPPASSPASQLAISVACDSVSLSLLQREDHFERATWSSQLLRLDKCRAYSLCGNAGKVHRFLSHEATLFEVNNAQENHAVANTPRTVQERAAGLKRRIVRKEGGSAAPIFYRSKLFPAISHISPSILLDIIGSEGEKSVFFSLYQMTYRYDPCSSWLERLQKLFSDLDFKESRADKQTSAKECGDTTSLTRLFVSFADVNVDYTAPEHFTTSSRSILRVGDLRFSSNIVKPATSVQAYSLSVGDLSWLLCNTRSPHNFENSLIPGASEIIDAKDPALRQTRARGASNDTVFRDLCSKTIVTLESIDAILVRTTTTRKSSAKEPRLTISLTVGEVSLYACKDSFQCFAESIGELQTMMTALTDKQIDIIRSEMPLDQEGGQVQTAPRKSASGHGDQIKSIDVATIPIDTVDDFLLDGYDWTTVDHQCRPFEIPPGEEQSARWFHSVQVNEGGDDSNARMRSQSRKPTTAPQIITQHFPLQVEKEPFEDGDKDEVSTLAGSDLVAVDTRVLLHDMKIKIRFFDGFDWPEYQGRRRRDTMAAFVMCEPEVDENENAEGNSQDVVNNQGTRSALLGGLLAGGNNSGAFGGVPLPEDRVRNKLAQNELRRMSRRTSTYIQVSAEGVSLRVDSYADSSDHRLKSILRLSARDIFLADKVSNLNPVKMFGEWFNEAEHPRDSKEGLLMFKMVTWEPNLPLTPENKLASDECEVAMTVAPMRCILDQRAVQFVTAFFGKKNGDGGDNWAADLHKVPEPFLRIFRVAPIKLKIDYSPQTIDTAALKNGSIVELINICPLDAMVLTLHQVEVEGVVGFGEALGNLVSHWLGDICATQMHKFVANARPFEPLSNIGGGVADLFVLPLDAYKNGENISRAVRYSVSSLLGTVAHETLTTSSRLTGFIAGEMAKATDTSQSSTAPSQNSLPSRPGVPRRMGDTAGHALESLARGVQTANFKVIVVPYREYRRKGTSGAVKSIARGIPLAIAAPVGGASEALSYTLLGARNQIRPDIRKEEEVSQRGLRYGSI